MKKTIIIFLLFAFNLLANQIPTEILSWYDAKVERSHEKFLKQYSEFIDSACAKYSFPYKHLAKAIPPKESKCRYNAKSPCGAKGFYGVMGGSFNPEKNIESGISILSERYKLYGDIEKTLMSYNAGPKGMKRAIRAYDRFKSGLSYDKKKLKVYYKIKRYAKDIMILTSHMQSKDNYCYRQPNYLNYNNIRLCSYLSI